MASAGLHGICPQLKRIDVAFLLAGAALLTHRAYQLAAGGQATIPDKQIKDPDEGQRETGGNVQG